MFALVAVKTPPLARHTPRATAWAGTRTPTQPVPPDTSPGIVVGRRQEQGQGAGPEPLRKDLRERGQSAKLRDDLRHVGGNQRHRAIERPVLDREEAADRLRAERIGGQSVQCLRGHHDDAARADGAGRARQDGRIRRR